MADRFLLPEPEGDNRGLGISATRRQLEEPMITIEMGAKDKEQISIYHTQVNSAFHVL